MIRTVVSLLIALTILFPACAVNRALLVGIGPYDTQKTGWGVIHGDNDVALLRPMLEKRGFTDVRALVNSKATKRAIVAELKALAARCRPGDKVYFHFSGHGQPIKDLNADERPGKGFDESIIPYDACRDSRKLNGTYNGQFHLIDDELAPLLNEIKEQLGIAGRLFVAVDACYSRGIQKDEYTDLDPVLLRYLRGTDNAFYPKGRPQSMVGNPPQEFSPGAKMTVVTACRENERNFEYLADNGKMYGSLSFYLYTLLKSSADFDIWEARFRNKDYAVRNIFQPTQHPSIEIIK